MHVLTAANAVPVRMVVTLCRSGLLPNFAQQAVSNAMREVCQIRLAAVVAAMLAAADPGGADSSATNEGNSSHSCISMFSSTVHGQW